MLTPKSSANPCPCLSWPPQTRRPCSALSLEADVTPFAHGRGRPSSSGCCLRRTGPRLRKVCAGGWGGPGASGRGDSLLHIVVELRLRGQIPLRVPYWHGPFARSFANKFFRTYFDFTVGILQLFSSLLSCMLHFPGFHTYQ